MRKRKKMVDTSQSYVTVPLRRLQQQQKAEEMAGE